MPAVTPSTIDAIKDGGLAPEVWARAKAGAKPMGSTPRQPPGIEPIAGSPASAQMMVAREFEELDAARGTMGWKLEQGLDATTIGLLSCHGAEPSHEDDRKITGKINQDCACVASLVGGQPGTALFCVYDGHGEFGRDVSQLAMHAMVHLLDQKHAELLKQQPTVALAAAFAQVQEELRAAPPHAVDATDSGACALVAYLRDGTLHVAGAGDTRAVLGTCCDGVLAAIALSTDHKVSTPAEASRIRKAGGYVKPAKSNGGPARVYSDSTMTAPGLAIARTLGDCDANAFGVIATPEVITHRIQPEDRMLIMASDGVWEFIGSSEAVEIVDACLEQGKSVGEACHHLVAKAAEAWYELEGDYRDDITACIVCLQPVAQSLERAAATARS